MFEEVNLKIRLEQVMLLEKVRKDCSVATLNKWILNFKMKSEFSRRLVVNSNVFTLFGL